VTIKILLESRKRPTRAYYGGRFWMFVDAPIHEGMICGAHFGMPTMAYNYWVAGTSPMWDQVYIDWMPGPGVDL